MALFIAACFAVSILALSGWIEFCLTAPYPQPDPRAAGLPQSAVREPGWDRVHRSAVVVTAEASG